MGDFSYGNGDPVLTTTLHRPVQIQTVSEEFCSGVVYVHASIMHSEI